MVVLVALTVVVVELVLVLVILVVEMAVAVVIVLDVLCSWSDGCWLNLCSWLCTVPGRSDT